MEPEIFLQKLNGGGKENRDAYMVLKGSLEGGKDGGWADLTISEIAEVLNRPYTAIHSAIKRIRENTGYEVPHADGWQKRREKLDELRE